MSVNTWQDAEARAAILDGAAAEQPEAVRKQALSALARLALDAANKQAMWQHAEARAAILDGPSCTAAVDSERPDASYRTTGAWIVTEGFRGYGTSSAQDRNPRWIRAKR